MSAPKQKNFKLSRLIKYHCNFRYGRVHCDSKKCKNMKLRVEHSMREKFKNKKIHNRKPFKKEPTEKPYNNELTEKPYKKKLAEKPYKKEPTDKPYTKNSIETPYGNDIETEEDMSFSEETAEYEDETTEYSMETKENKEVNTFFNTCKS